MHIIIYVQCLTSQAHNIVCYCVIGQDKLPEFLQHLTFLALFACNLCNACFSLFSDLSPSYCQWYPLFSDQGKSFGGVNGSYRFREKLVGEALTL